MARCTRSELIAVSEHEVCASCMGVKRACATTADTAEDEQPGAGENEDEEAAAGKRAHAKAAAHPDEFNDGNDRIQWNYHSHLLSHAQNQNDLQSPLERNNSPDRQAP